MKERIPVGIYPFQAELLPIIRRFDQLQQKYRLTSVLSFPGSGLLGKDVAYACNLPETGIQVEPFTKDNLEGIESLIVVNPLISSEKTERDLLSFSRIALQNNKKVHFCCNLTDNIVESAIKLKDSFPGFAFSFDTNQTANDTPGNSVRYKRLDVPVIFVGSLVENPDTLETICYLFENFFRINVKCLVFSKTSAGALFGFKSIMPIINMNEIAESIKVEEMNRYAHNLISEINPDLVLVEAPDAVIRFNDITPNGFGIHSYMMAQAFQPDYFICSIPFDLADPNMITSLSKDFEVRLGIPINAVISTNIIVDSAENLQSHIMSHVYVPTDYSRAILSKNINENIIPVFEIVDKSDPGLFNYLCGLVGLTKMEDEK